MWVLKITYRKTKNYLSSKNDPLPWDAKSDPRGEGLEVLGNEEGSCRSPIRRLFGQCFYVVLGKADIVFYIQPLSS